jgi:hypothetical protein
MNMPNPSDQLTTLNLINRGLKRVLPNSQALSLAIILLVSFVFIYFLAYQPNGSGGLHVLLNFTFCP